MQQNEESSSSFSRQSLQIMVDVIYAGWYLSTGCGISFCPKHLKLASRQQASRQLRQYAPICCPGHLDCSALCLTMIGRCTPCVGLFKYYVAKRYNAFEKAQYAQICCLGHLVWPWLTMFRVAHVSCLSQANADIRWRSVCDTDCG